MSADLVEASNFCKALKCANIRLLLHPWWSYSWLFETQLIINSLLQAPDGRPLTAAALNGLWGSAAHSLIHLEGIRNGKLIKRMKRESCQNSWKGSDQGDFSLFVLFLFSALLFCRTFLINFIEASHCHEVGRWDEIWVSCWRMEENIAKKHSIFIVEKLGVYSSYHPVAVDAEEEHKVC